MFFVDWLNMVQDFEPDKYPDFYGGRVVSVHGTAGLSRSPVVLETGEITERWTMAGVDDIEYTAARFTAHRGTFETHLFIRLENGRLEVRGNPSSWARLDNLFGVTLDDAVAIYNHILGDLGLPQFTTGERKHIWLQSDQRYVDIYTGSRITKIDLTCNIAVGMGNVGHLNKWLARQRLYRSSPSVRDLDQFEKWDYSTVYISESKFWINAKCYDKGKNIEDVMLPQYCRKLSAARRRGDVTRGQEQILLAEAERYLEQLACWCAEIGLARIEYSFRSRWFRQNEDAGHWSPSVTADLMAKMVNSEFAKIEERAVVYQNIENDLLTDKEYRLLEGWKRGANPRDIVSRSAFYRFRNSIMNRTGYDIAAHPVGLGIQETRIVHLQMRPVSISDAPSFYRPAVVPRAA